MNYDTLDADVVKILPVHYTPGRGGKSIKFVGIHYNAGDLTVEQCYNVWLTREASAHYQVEKSGRTGQLVYDGDTGWALGVFSKNQESINIEHANNPDGTISEACLDAGAHLTAAICKKFGLGRPEWLVNVYPHKYFKATQCPGQIYGSQKDAYIQRAQYWYDVMTGAATQEPETVPLPDALKSYTDIDPNGWYVDALDKAVQAGYLHGYSDTIMAPNDNLTRGQATVVIANAAGYDMDTGDPYSDVKANPYYYNSVVWAKEQGIINDKFESFRPSDACTREEFVAMLYNWKGKEPKGEPAGYSDWSDVDDWAKESMAWAVENAVVSGNAGKLRPRDACTRAEAAAMMVNLLL